TVALHVDDPSVQRLLGGKRNRVQQEVELTPFLPDVLEHLLHLPIDSDIQRQEKRRIQVLCKRLDVLSGAIVQISHRKIRSQRAERLGATPGDRLIVGDADDKPFAPPERDPRFGEYRDGHEAFSLAWADGRLRYRSDRVCCAIISSSSVGTT